MFIEPGASATDDSRPELQRMIDAAVSSDRPFDVVVVHSFSRFFRDAFQLELYRRKLAKVDVRLESITQHTSDDSTGDMYRQMLAVFDEHNSRENAKHTLRAMKENARQGFWNGSQAPYGYKVVDAEQRGQKVKKRLAGDPKEAETVREIFRLYQHGAGRLGPLGVKAIAAELNLRGLRNRRGRRFSHKVVHEILTREDYIGQHWFNRLDSRTKKTKPRSEWIAVEVPPIIGQDAFATVRAMLAARNPRTTPPRIVNGPTLLSGLARCATCGSGMTLRTGKGGRYRYYTCASRRDE